MANQDMASPKITNDVDTPRLNKSGNRRGMRNLQKMDVQGSVGRSGNKPPDEVRILLTEAGSTGLKTMGGPFGFISEAYIQDYSWPNVSALYTRLRRSDPEMLMIGSAFSAWSRNIGLLVDLPDKATDVEKKYQDFLYQVFDDMEGGFSQLVETMARRVPFDGWFVWEAVPGLRDPKWVPPPSKDVSGVVWPDEWRSSYNDGYIGFRRLSPRDTSTFNGWIFDANKRARAMIQQDFPNQSITLPLNRCLHMVYGDSNNPEGASPLEGIARLERLKYGYEVVMGIGSEHVAGYLNVKKTNTGSLSPEDKENVATAARNILTAQEGNYALWPYGMDGEVKDTSFAAAAAVLETIKYYSVTKLAVYMMQFISFNIFTRTGALASATDSSQIAVLTFNSMMDGFASQLDNQLGQRLYEWNKDSFPGLERRPRLRFKHIDKEPELVQMGQFFRSMDGILQLGEDDMKAIRDKTGFLPKGLPTKPITPVATAANAFPRTNPKGTNPQPGAGNATEPPPASAIMSVEEAITRLEILAKEEDSDVYRMFIDEQTS